MSPFLFRLYVRELVASITSLGYGCNIGGMFVNLLCYADDMVLLAPSWPALQNMLYTLESAAQSISMSFNTLKTLCMVFIPTCKRKIVCDSFPNFRLAGQDLAFVTSFKYLGHIIENTNTDDSDISREIKKLFSRTNLLVRKFNRCSVLVKVKLFTAYCLCFYDISLWRRFSVHSFTKFRSCYYKCMKVFFGYSKYSSVTQMLLKLQLPSINTVMHNATVSFHAISDAVANCIVHAVNWCCSVSDA